jgi:hypothetical protein
MWRRFTLYVDPLNRFDQVLYNRTLPNFGATHEILNAPRGAMFLHPRHGLGIEV